MVGCFRQEGFGLWAMSGDIDDHRQGCAVGRRLNDRHGHFAAGHFFNVLPSEAEVFELSQSGLAKLIFQAFDERLHCRIVDQLPPLRALEIIDQLAEVGHRDIAFRGGRQ